MTQTQTIHDLKIAEVYFRQVCLGTKTFEVRKDDRDFRVGDWLRLREVDGALSYTGGFVTVIVTYKLPGGRHGIEPGYCVLGIRKATDGDYDTATG